MHLTTAPFGTMMKKRIKEYLKQMELILAQYLNGSRHSTEKDADLHNLLIQIQFFQHERLIHLLVTLAVVILFFSLTLFVVAYQASLPIMLVHLLLFALMIPYIVHYFSLENGVQKLYRIYDQIQQSQ